MRHPFFLCECDKQDAGVGSLAKKLVQELTACLTVHSCVCNLWLQKVAFLQQKEALRWNVFIGASNSIPSVLIASSFLSNRESSCGLILSGDARELSGDLLHVKHALCHWATAFPNSGFPGSRAGGGGLSTHLLPEVVLTGDARSWTRDLLACQPSSLPPSFCHWILQAIMPHFWRILDCTDLDNFSSW